MAYISVVTPCFNEEANVQDVYEQVKEVFDELPDHTYEHIFIDNASKDKTVAILKEIATKDKNVKIIVNNRNFGQTRSPLHAIYQASGDAIIGIVADLQDPPHMIKDFIAKWEEGYKVVLGIKSKSEESFLFYSLRTLYYRVLRTLSETELIEHFTGFGLYDREVIGIIRGLDDQYPYFRGLIADFGFDAARIEYTQRIRKRGISKNNFYTLYDLAMLGLTSHSKVPLRLAAMLGFFSAAMSLVVAGIYLLYKLIFWQSFSLGLAPLVVGLFFFSSVQLFFLGLVGEYVGSIHTQILKRPMVVERERINFDQGNECLWKRPLLVSVQNGEDHGKE